MRLYEIQGTYLGLQKHFDYNGANKNFDFKEPIFVPVNFKKRSNFEFLTSKTKGAIRLFFVFMIFNGCSDLYRIREQFESDEFKTFAFFIRNYKQRFLDDLELLLDIRDFEEVFELYYLNKISPVTFYYVSMVLFPKEANKKIKTSNIVYDMFYKVKQLMKLMNIDEEFVTNTIRSKVNLKKL